MSVYQSKTTRLTHTFPPKYTHSLLVKLEYIGINEGKNASHMRFSSEQRLVLFQEWHMLPNLTVSVEYQLEAVSPCACSLTSIHVSMDCECEYHIGENMLQRKVSAL
jgi:hypothetical protein